MDKKIFAFQDQFANLAAYEKLGFNIQIDDAANGIYYVEVNLNNYDWLAVLSLLEDCERFNLQPILQFGDDFINEGAIAYADRMAAEELN